MNKTLRTIPIILSLLSLTTLCHADNELPFRERHGRSRNGTTNKNTGVSLPVSFLTSPSTGRTLIKNDAHKQFDLYLLLLKKQGAEAKDIPINYNTLAQEVGYSVPQNLGRYRNAHNYYYEHVHRALKKLKAKALIKYNKGTVRIIPLKKDKGEFIIPYSYWKKSKANNLSLRAKYLYLIALYEASRSTKRPSWFRSQKDMSRLYGISDTTISKGMLELEEKGLVKITRDKATPPDFSDRDANVYMVL